MVNWVVNPPSTYMHCNERYCWVGPLTTGNKGIEPTFHFKSICWRKPRWTSALLGTRCHSSWNLIVKVLWLYTTLSLLSARGWAPVVHVAQDYIRPNCSKFLLQKIRSLEVSKVNRRELPLNDDAVNGPMAVLGTKTVAWMLSTSKGSDNDGLNLAFLVILEFSGRS
jgi:hypothetical protein